MAERFKAAVLKTVVLRNRDRRFESYSLRQRLRGHFIRHRQPIL